MRLSESLRRNMMKLSGGGIINRFKARGRRTTFFFEDILAEYVKECDDSGHSDAIRDAGSEWMILTIRYLAPSNYMISAIIRKFPITTLFNKIAKKIWTNIGLVEDINVKKSRGRVTIETKAEFITRIIGRNSFMVGTYMGILAALTERNVEIQGAMQTRKKCRYTYILGNKREFNIKGKKKDDYLRLNSSNEKIGFVLKDALNRRVFELKENNRVFFRGKSLIPIENTVYHILSNKKIELERLSRISYNYFSGILQRNLKFDKMLMLMKNIFQFMGWGVFKIIKGKEIKVEIKNPPHGLLLHDNWEFLARVILGYLWLMDRKLKIESIRNCYRKTVFTYSK